jgi:hypothetical protein
MYGMRFEFLVGMPASSGLEQHGAFGATISGAGVDIHDTGRKERLCDTACVEMAFH